MLLERPVDEKNRITPIKVMNIINSVLQSTGQIPSIAVPKPSIQVQLL